MTQQHAALRLLTPAESSNSVMKTSTISTVRMYNCRQVCVHRGQWKRAEVCAYTQLLSQRLKSQSTRLTTKQHVSHWRLQNTVPNNSTSHILYVSMTILDLSCLFVCILIILALHSKFPQTEPLQKKQLQPMSMDMRHNETWTQHQRRGHVHSYVSCSVEHGAKKKGFMTLPCIVCALWGP